MSQPQPEREPTTVEDVEAWRDLQDVLEERDREWWAGDPDNEY
ncbi:MAG TPA: hypothetical protein VGE38_07090 [Nocardioides sp.]